MFGLPKGVDIENTKKEDIWMRSLRRNKPDMVFLQMQPCNFMARQRYLAHKSALNGVEDFDVKAIENINPDVPMSWEETVVNLEVLDMLQTNQLHTDVDFTEGFTTFSYPYHYDKEKGGAAITKPFVENINTHVVGKDFSEYNIMNQILYQGLMGNHKIMMGEMPEILLRQIIANSLT